MKERISLFFSQEYPLKTVWKTIGKLDFLGNQTPQNMKEEKNQRGWLLLSLSLEYETSFGFLNEGS